MSKLWTLTGPSCSGKTTLIRHLLETDLFCEVKSFTSRDPRGGEVEGIDYFFKTVEDAKSLIDNKLVAESTLFKGNYYGITKEEIDARLNSGKIPIVIVEPHGLSQLRANYDCVSIYVDATLPLLYERFLSRFQQSPNANIKYEASRLASLHTELVEWRTKFRPNTWVFNLQSFTEDNQESIIASLTNYAKNTAK